MTFFFNFFFYHHQFASLFFFFFFYEKPLCNYIGDDKDQYATIKQTIPAYKNKQTILNYTSLFKKKHYTLFFFFLGTKQTTL